MKWQQQRQMLLAIAFVGVLFALVRLSLDPTAANRRMSAFTFPSVVPLPGWQLRESHPLANPVTSYDKMSEVVLASQKYSYSQNDQQIEVEIRYVAGTLGDLHGYFQNYNSIRLRNGQLLQNLRQQQGIGFYSLFVHQRRAHLSACINPRGGSTVTSDQFLANRYTYDLQLQRLLPWLLGKEGLGDKRCLWVDLSTPLNQDAETTYPVLEQVWRSWYQWWSSRFP